MAEGEEWRHLRAELETLRREVAEMRAEQQAMARSLEQMHQTFRMLAVHLGIGAEPYRKGAAKDSPRDLPGFA